MAKKYRASKPLRHKVKELSCSFEVYRIKQRQRSNMGDGLVLTAPEELLSTLPQLSDGLREVFSKYKPSQGLEAKSVVCQGDTTSTYR
jgi:hypothetical protein